MSDSTPEQTDTQYNFAVFGVDEDENYRYLGLYTEDTRDDVVEHIQEMAGSVMIHGHNPSTFEELDVYTVGDRTTHPAPNNPHLDDTPQQ